MSCVQIGQHFNMFCLKVCWNEGRPLNIFISITNHRQQHMRLSCNTVLRITSAKHWMHFPRRWGQTRILRSSYTPQFPPSSDTATQKLSIKNKGEFLHFCDISSSHFQKKKRLNGDYRRYFCCICFFFWLQKCGFELCWKGEPGRMQPVCALQNYVCDVVDGGLGFLIVDVRSAVSV